MTSSVEKPTHYTVRAHALTMAIAAQLPPPPALEQRLSHAAAAGVGDTAVMEWTPQVGDDVVVQQLDGDTVAGRVVEDFGDFPAHAVDIGDDRIAEPARRWAIHTEDGGLVFADTNELTASVDRRQSESR